MTAGTADFMLCGWRLRSEIALPELPRLHDEGAVDVTIRLDRLPPADAAIVATTPFLAVEAGGACRLAIASVGRLLIRDGRQIIVEPAGSAESPELRMLLYGGALAVLCHQRSLLPLHAAGVEIAGRAVLLAGASGIGKSTLAAVLARRGHRVLADDIGVVDPAGGPAIRPFGARIVLWRAALDAFGIAADGLPEYRRDRQRHQLMLPGAATDLRPRNCAAIYLLRRSGGDEALQPVAPAEMAGALAPCVHTARIARWLRPADALPEALAALAKSVPAFRLPFRPGLEHLDATAARLEAHGAAWAA